MQLVDKLMDSLSVKLKILEGDKKCTLGREDENTKRHFA
jgi:hypothetical protein